VHELTSGSPLTDDDLIAAYAMPADRRWVRANFVSSLDGAAYLDGRSEGLSGPADHRVFGILRMLCDAVLVGAGTLRDEQYKAVRPTAERREWRLAHGLAEHPTLVIASGRLDLAPDHPALDNAPVRPVVLTGARGTADARLALEKVADVVVLGEDTVDLPAALDELERRGLRRILTEGGPHLFGALTAAGLVDELCLTLSPLLAGAGASRISAGFAAMGPHEVTLRHTLHADGMLFLRYSR
jgi:riboflavin biosynthesis pyrimidine reductase